MPPDIDELGFEEALEQLEQIVAELEAGELPLQEALDKFEQGMKLKQFCEQKLAEAEVRIERYVESQPQTQEGDEGTLSE